MAIMDLKRMSLLRALDIDRDGDPVTARSSLIDVTCGWGSLAVVPMRSILRDKHEEATISPRCSVWETWRDLPLTQWRSSRFRI